MSAAIDVATRGTRITPRVALRSRLRSASVWIVGAAVVLITVIVTMLMTGDREVEDPLHYDGTGRQGMRALVETLRDHGTEVSTTEDLATAREAGGQPDTTLLIPAGAEVLTPGDADGLRSALAPHRGRLVLVDPGDAIAAFTDRLDVEQNTAPLAQPDPTSAPECRVPAATAAGSVSTGGSLYTATPAGDGQIRGCYPFAGPGVSTDDTEQGGQLLVDDAGPVPVTVLANPAWLSNGEIDENGNAALALSTLSETTHLVVYYPRPAPGEGPPPSTLDQVPGWFIAGALWLVPCAVVALLVLGRRFGPLAVERLPVVVPAVETVHGRAALSERSHDRAGALHALRTASLLRIAARLALGPDARDTDILTRIAATTGRDPDRIAAVFRTASPTTDRELTDLVDSITTIESEIP